MFSRFVLEYICRDRRHDCSSKEFSLQYAFHIGCKTFDSYQLTNHFSNPRIIGFALRIHFIKREKYILV